MSTATADTTPARGPGGGGVSDLVAAWAPSLWAQAEVMSMLFDSGLNQVPELHTGQRAKCGSYLAYKQHLRYGEETCEACRAANAERRRTASARRDRRIRRARPLGQKRPVCGSNAAYCQHLYYGEFPVDPVCLAAHTAYVTRTETARKSRIPT